MGGTSVADFVKDLLFLRLFSCQESVLLFILSLGAKFGGSGKSIQMARERERRDRDEILIS